MVQENHLEGMLKQRLLSPAPQRVALSSGVGTVICISNRFPPALALLLVPEPHLRIGTVG